MNREVKILIALMLFSTFSFGQNGESETLKDETVQYKHSIGSSFFMLGNFLEDSPDYYLLTYGYQLTQKGRVFAEFNTWKYTEPLGTYGKSKGFYPGFVRAWGIGGGYQRFHWKGLFTTVQATSFMKQYYHLDDEQIQKGFQLYVQIVAGYRFQFFKERFYVEPAWALKYWPVDTNLPTDFAQIEKGKPKHIFEPSFNFGFKF